MLKENLKNNVREQLNIEGILLEIAEFDSNTMQLRLKDSCLKEFDPYFFHKTKAFSKSIIENF